MTNHNHQSDNKNINNEPKGQANAEFYENGQAEDILVETNYTEGEHIPPEYFFRTEKGMPPIEKKALELCKGRILDVGAAAGSHSLWLQNKGLEVTALEKSELACGVMK